MTSLGADAPLGRQRRTGTPVIVWDGRAGDLVPYAQPRFLAMTTAASPRARRWPSGRLRQSWDQSRFSIFQRKGIGASSTPERFLRNARQVRNWPVGMYGTNSKARC